MATEEPRWGAQTPVELAKFTGRPAVLEREWME